MQAHLLRTLFMEIPFHIATDCVLTGDARAEFEMIINDLLSTLECLVDGVKVLAKASETTIETRFNPSPGLKNRCPKLLALGTLLPDRSESTSLEEHGQHLNLRQDAYSFRLTRFAVQRFQTSAIDLMSKKESTRTQTPSIQGTQAPTVQPQTRFSEAFWSGSKTLFESLVTHLKSCHNMNLEREAKYSGHEAMLQLKQSQDSEGSESCPKVCIALASCPDRKTWHQTVCTISSRWYASPPDAPQFANSGANEWGSKNPSSTNSDAPMLGICQEAKQAYREYRAFSIELEGANFLKNSPSAFGSSPAHSEAKPTISLSYLLNEGILKDPYRFSAPDKRILAFTLAHALLQFFQGPWLQTLWTPDHLYFMYDASTGTVYNIHQPYISCMLSGDPPPLEPLEPDHPYPLILSFAKVLLELETGKEVKAEMTSRSEAPSLFLPLWKYCEDWSDKQLDDYYAKALKTCVNFADHFKNEKRKDPKKTIRDVILSHIVHPLETRLLVLDMSWKSKLGLRNLDLKDRISTTGQRDDIASPIDSAQLLAVPSDYSRVDNMSESKIPNSRVTQLKTDAPINSSRVTSGGTVRKPNLPLRKDMSKSSRKGPAVSQVTKATAGKRTILDRPVQSKSASGGLVSAESSSQSMQRPTLHSKEPVPQRLTVSRSSSLSRGSNSSKGSSPSRQLNRPLTPQQPRSADDGPKRLSHTSKHRSISAEPRIARQFGPQQPGGQARYGRSASSGFGLCLSCDPKSTYDNLL